MNRVTSQRLSDHDASGASASDASYSEDFTAGSHQSGGAASAAVIKGRMSGAATLGSVSSASPKTPPVSSHSLQSRSDPSVLSSRASQLASVTSSSYTSVTSHSSLVNGTSHHHGSRAASAAEPLAAAGSSSSSSHNSLSQHTISQNTLSQHTISHPSRSEHSHSRDSQKQQRDSSSYRDSKKKKDGNSIHSDDTSLDGTLTPSVSSGDEQKSSRGDNLLSADRSLVLSSKHKDDSDVSTLSMSDDERASRAALIRDQERVGSFGHMPSLPIGGRLGPDSLSHRLTAELNLYEGQEEMLRQISNIERVRASALAQQESVAIAQVNKVGHNYSGHHVKRKMYFPRRFLCVR